MQKNPRSQSGIFTLRVLAAFLLCSAGILLAMLGFAATPPDRVTELAAKSPNESLLVNRTALALRSGAKTRLGTSLAQSTTSGWSIFSSPNNTSGDSAQFYNALSSVTCTSASDCWSGTFTHWDGTSWSIVSSPGGGRVTCTSALDCWAVGVYLYGSVYQTLIQHWDGNGWTIVTSPNANTQNHNYLFDVTCTS